MGNYFYAELIKEKREKHLFLSVICVVITLLAFTSNLYKVTKQGGVVDLYCDNMQIHFFITLIFVTMYAIVIIYDEFKNNTIEQLSVIPINQGKFVLTKFIFVVIFSIVTMLMITALSIAIMAFMGYKINAGDIFVLVMLNVADGILLAIVTFPVMLISMICRSQILISIVINAVYIISCFMINNLPFGQDITEKLTAYGHPLGSYALIHNWIVYKNIPKEISMLSQPKQSFWLALISIGIYTFISYQGIKAVLKNNKGR